MTTGDDVRDNGLPIFNARVADVDVAQAAVALEVDALQPPVEHGADQRVFLAVVHGNRHVRQRMTLRRLCAVSSTRKRSGSTANTCGRSVICAAYIVVAPPASGTL